MMDNPFNVQTFAVRSIRRKGKRRVVLTGEIDGTVLGTRTIVIPDNRMRDVQKFMREFDGTLLVDFDVPIEYPRQAAQFFLEAIEQRVRQYVQGEV